MRLLFLTVAILFAVTTSTANGFQLASLSPAPNPGGGGGTPALTWKFTHPLDGMQCFGNVLFAGTGPNSDAGGLSVYSYTNTIPGGVLASELQLQISVIVDTDPGIDWTGPIYEQVGENYATIMPALGVPNIGLLSLVGGGGFGGTGTDVSTLTSLNGGQGVLFGIVEP